MISNIYGITFDGLERYFIKNNLNKAKAKLVYNHIYKNTPLGVSPETAAKISEDFRGFSSDFAPDIKPDIEIIDTKQAPETVKFLFKFPDNNTAEAVLMRQDYGNALCVSTQIGCNMNCAFCCSGGFSKNAENLETAKPRKVRDLLPHEMTLQLIAARNFTREQISRVTLMGIGEPLDNYANVTDFIKIITHRHGLDIPPRRVTLSTCGLVPMIKQLAADGINCSLAVSLNATNNTLRDKLMPINKTYNIESLTSAAREYAQVTKRKVAFEYVMLDKVNDTNADAHRLAELVRGINCYVNLIPYNRAGLAFKRSSPQRLKNFYEILIQSGVRAVVRREFGAEINAACGQLRQRTMYN